MTLKSNITTSFHTNSTFVNSVLILELCIFITNNSFCNSNWEQSFQKEYACQVNWVAQFELSIFATKYNHEQFQFL